MTRSRFSQTTNPTNKSSSVANAIAQLAILGISISITIMAAIFVQNLQPAVQIVLLGQKISPIPLSAAMLGAFIIGGFIAFGFNAIATWRHNLAIRRALANRYGNDQIKTENKVDDEYEDEEYEDEEYDDIYKEDEDSDTVPYGDRAPLEAKYTKEN
jgi:uncharacterized integral membrane protein